MANALAVGKVVNGRITVITADGKGYSRPVPPRPSVVEVAESFAKEIKGKDDGEPPVYMPINVMPWMQRWMEEKQAANERRKKEEARRSLSLFRRILTYFK